MGRSPNVAARRHEAFHAPRRRMDDGEERRCGGDCQELRCGDRDGQAAPALSVAFDLRLEVVITISCMPVQGNASMPVQGNAPMPAQGIDLCLHKAIFV